MNPQKPVFSDFSDLNEYARPLRALIKLSSFQANLQCIAGRVGDARILVVIKADAYGHGLLEIARAAGDADLAVAIPEELHALRSAGINNRVWVLEGPFTSECLRQSTNVVWVIHSLWQLDLLHQAHAQGYVEQLDICIKLDSGMHRLGFSVHDQEALLHKLSSFSFIAIVCIMTHFAGSDIPDNPHVIRQIAQFDQMLVQLNWKKCQQSLANSGAVLFYPESYRDWVRPGIMLYGGKPSPNTDCPLVLEPVMSFQSAIIALHKVKEGESVGYGAAWAAKKDSLIATVAVGYADGYPRHAPNGTPVSVKSQKTGQEYSAYLVGRVSMDMITIDVSAIPEAMVGDLVELWGESVPVDVVAGLAGTISYQLFTNVSKRVPRVYRA